MPPEISAGRAAAPPQADQAELDLRHRARASARQRGVLLQRQLDVLDQGHASRTARRTATSPRSAAAARGASAPSPRTDIARQGSRSGPRPAGSSPIMCFSRVDLPQPEPPRMTKTSPRRTSKVTSSKTVRPSKRAAMSSTADDDLGLRDGSAVRWCSRHAAAQPCGRKKSTANRPSSRMMETMPPTTARSPHRPPRAGRARRRARRGSRSRDGQAEEAALNRPPHRSPRLTAIAQLGDAPWSAGSRETPSPRHAEQPGQVQQQRTAPASPSRRHHARQHQQATGSMPMMRSASTSSFTLMVPSSAA